MTIWIKSTRTIGEKDGKSKFLFLTEQRWLSKKKKTFLHKNCKNILTALKYLDNSESNFFHKENQMTLSL